MSIEQILANYQSIMTVQAGLRQIPTLVVIGDKLKAEDFSLRDDFLPLFMNMAADITNFELGVIVPGSTPSVIISGGTATVAPGSTDQAGRITVNNTGTSILVLTYSGSYMNKPTGFANNETHQSNDCTVAGTLTTLTITCITTSGDVIAYGTTS